MNYSAPLFRTDGSGSTSPVPEFDLANSRLPEFDEPAGSLIGDLIAAVRRNVVGLLVWILVCVAGAVGYVVTAQPEFLASAQIALEPRLRLPPGADAAAAAAATAPTLDSAQAESQLQVIRSVRNLRYVFDTLKLDADPAYADAGPGMIGRILGAVGRLLPFGGGSSLSPEEAAARAREIAFQNFSDRVQVRRLGQSYVLEVSFRGLTARDAARITNGIAASYIRDQVLVRAASDQRGSEFLQGRIATIQAEKKAADEAVASGVIQPDVQFPDSDARIVGAALEPLTTAYPRTKLILLLAGLFGIASGIGAIAVLHSFDRVVRTPGQIRQTLGVDCLAVVPRLRHGAARLPDTAALDHPTSDFAQALRLLRAVLFTAGNDGQPVSVGFVSCLPDEGRSALSVNLACLLAASSDRVVLIDADLQNPDLSRRLAPRAEAGLDEFLRAHRSGADLPELPLAGTLSFVPAAAEGRTAHPNTFLGASPMREALTRFDGRRDLILDLPALSRSSDVQAIGDLLSGVVLVAALNRTTLDQLTEARRSLHAANIRVLGVVLNEPDALRKSRRSVFASALAAVRQ
ncbi:hypothetical protein LKMONMHP_3320 [Methylobacterium organophilum]|uniref:CobQ/CobB/MinD/ParA nucleotide binding domain-containing protein n=1 Tax=Methylobacterium organophilum TaxID=410 RepID=A0ABQ4TD65_METOR|nr:hypothetical protein LKMONMHP_3320 [Methylobacterium organophilum]